MLSKITLTFLFITSLVFVVRAQDYDYTLSDDSLVNHYASMKRVYYATRTSMAPKIDGKLDDECWQKIGTWDGDFIQQQPHQAIAPSQETEIKILYDDKYLYFAIVAHDNEPEEMDPILGRRDELNGDIAGIALDSYQDKQTAFEFNLTSAGQKVDLMHMGEYGWDFNWNAVWDGKTSLGDSAWYAEMRVPFTQIRFANVDEHVWGMHIWRYVYRLSEESQWKLIPVDAPAMVYIFGELRGIENIPYKRNFEIMPYASSQYFPNSDDKTNLGFGVDGKIGVSSNFTLDYTFNPDFGQVEADPSELNLTSYEVFYDEKRPFFLEGNSILEYNSGHDMLFYSRRIGHAPSYEPYYDEYESFEMPENTSIINALKLTGKNKKGFSLGLVNSMTARETATIKTADETIKEAVEPFSNYSIARVKQDFNEGSTVLGGIVTSSIRNIKDENLEFLTDNSLVGGLDFEHNWKNRKYYVAAKGFTSRISGSEESIARLQRNSRHYFQREDASYLEYDPTRTSLSGWGGELAGGKRSGKLRITGDVEWRSPGVDLNDVGYLRQADYIDQNARIQYLVNKPKGLLLNYSFRLAQGHNWTFNGDNLRDNFSFTTALRFKNYWRFNLAVYKYLNEIDTRRLRGGPSLRIDNRNRLAASVQTNAQRDFFVGFMTDFSRSADDITLENSYNFQMDWRISTRFMLSSSSTFVNEQDNSQYLRRSSVNGNSEYVVGNLDRKTFYTTFRAEYFITPELSLQYYGSPYVSSGKYVDYRRVNDSKAKDLNQRFEFLSRDGNYLTDNDGNVYHDFSSYDFDFNFQEFRSNFVARWEYKTGSTFYFVWSHNRSAYQEAYNSSLLDSFKDIRKISAENAFMIKFSYWFSL
ncbi:DUF5916 domain-containing protein [Draconibacterium sp. IB214405]|uniref:DUF5916 domain-containing protein n=1 Tax=Draconibacterium sp. IB214405 TaxID=3097352 RepID=UPI002A0AA2ED|nr:DUF5916 domain-containing protein [Draconibacterium sp. IB214405]MDX8339448.1 DUF5916 domain-containing protein [Draconibacterium sp. IB214405]